MMENLGDRMTYFFGALVASLFYCFFVLASFGLTMIMSNSISMENVFFDKMFWFSLILGLATIYLAIATLFLSYTWFYESWYCVERGVRGNIMSYSKRTREINENSITFRFYKFAGKVLIYLHV